MSLPRSARGPPVRQSRSADGWATWGPVVLWGSMKLFHLADAEYRQLQPQLGAKRHGGEDPRAVGVPVVWLSNDQGMRAQRPNREVPQFQHEVDVPDDDPYLFVDEPFAAMSTQYDKMFGTRTTLRWYFLKRAVDVTTVRRWDPVLGTYVE